MKNLHPFKKLSKNFYTRSLLVVAKELLGKILVKKEGRILLAGEIVEVEAYDGLTDEAAHTFIGRTKRNEIMFNEGGYFYVYFTYGAHFCCNIVTGKKDHGTAVLIRAVEPLTGIEKMALNRYNKLILTEKEKHNLTSGPGKVCEAFNITKEHYGIDLTGDQIFLLDRPKLKKNDIEVSKRVGIKKSIDLPWRFYIKNNPYISRK
ncbi:MAG: DNA-3-methyladenine glycosylase [Ignavibacteriales bacterium]|nr:MAG: DNA-3-methyladenine glycosylase [Ignavibacteriales bacterium]